MSSVHVVQVHTALLSSPAHSQTPPPLQVWGELSDGRECVVRRTDTDLAWMMKRLVDGFPDDRNTLSNELLSGLLKVRATEKSTDADSKVLEVNKLLTTIIELPQKFSQSEAVRTFFGLDQDQDPAQDWTRDPTKTAGKGPEKTSVTQEEPRDPSPGPDQVSLCLSADVLRCNGFCLANTETIFFDQSQHRDQRMDQSELSSRGAAQSEHGRRASTSCLGHAPNCGLSHMIGQAVRGRSLNWKKSPASQPNPWW
ncbi:unnamed protein product [Knipowitschia caucasica]